MKTKQGFTIVELAVTMLIVAILAAIVTPRLALSKDKVIVTEALATISTVNTAGQIYVLETGTAPANYADLDDQGIITSEILSGTYFQPSDYEAWEFSPKGKVMKLITTKWEINWETTQNKYVVNDRNS